MSIRPNSSRRRAASATLPVPVRTKTSIAVHPPGTGTEAGILAMSPIQHSGRLKNRRSTRCRSRPAFLVPRVAPALMNAQKSFGLTAVPSKASMLPATSWPTASARKASVLARPWDPASRGDISPASMPQPDKERNPKAPFLASFTRPHPSPLGQGASCGM